MIHTNIIAKVEKYDEEEMVADLQPLFLDDDGQPYQKIINARVLSQRFLLPKKQFLEGGQVNHSNIHDAGSHTIYDGHQIIKRDEDYEHEDYEVFPLYEKGDLVVVMIIERDFSDALGGAVGNGGSEAKHELTSAVITGKVAMP